MSTQPPCTGKSALFDSTDARSHNEARALCATCPMLTECYEQLQKARSSAYGHVPQGTWAGMLCGRRKAEDAERLAREDAIYDEREALDAHNAYNQGDRGAWAVTGHRVWDRRYRRRRNQERAA